MALKLLDEKEDETVDYSDNQYEYVDWVKADLVDKGQRLVGATASNSSDFPFIVAFNPVPVEGSLMSSCTGLVFILIQGQNLMYWRGC